MPDISSQRCAIVGGGISGLSAANLLKKQQSAVCLEDGSFVDYPIENHVYQMTENMQRGFYADVDEMLKHPGRTPSNFDEFLRGRFGETLYKLYFRPYNAKVCRRDLTDIPLSWLEGKLPMPTPHEQLLEDVRACKAELPERTRVGHISRLKSEMNDLGLQLKLWQGKSFRERFAGWRYVCAQGGVVRVANHFDDSSLPAVCQRPDF